MLEGSRAREEVRGLPGYAPSYEIRPLGTQVRGQGWGQIRCWVKTREAAAELSSPRGGLGAPWVCPDL